MSATDKAASGCSALLYDLLLQGVPETFFIGPRRRVLIAPLRGLVLEIGAGTGLSLRYYHPSAQVVATEPDPASIKRLAGKIAKSKALVMAVRADAMELPFPGATFDGLVCNLALCTIPNPALALSEAVRVLKPGAPLRFLEHVRADHALQGRVQDAIAPAWKHIAGGCRLNQDTESLIKASGLRIERVEKLRGLILPMRLIWCRKSDRELNNGYH